MSSAPSKTIGQSLIKPSWKDMHPIFSIARTTKDSSPDIAPDLDQNTNVVAPSESQEVVINMNGSSTAEGGGPILEATPDMLSNLSKIEAILRSLDVGPLAFPLAGPMTQQSSCCTADDFDMHLECSYDIIWILLRTSYKVTISAFTETGQAESSIKVPKQWAYISQWPIIPSSITDTPCTDLGLQGILDQLNIILKTSYSLDTPSISSILKDCISNNYDFGTAYGHLCYVWRKVKYSTVQDQLCIYEKKDQKRQQEALIEMLNLGLEYMWLDVLCLRQDGGPSEDLCKEEWKLDIPTIGQVYRWNDVVTYLSGLGWSLSLKESDLDSDQIQEVGICNMIIAEDTPDGPMHAKPIDKDGNYDRQGLRKWRPTWDQVMMKPLPADDSCSEWVDHDDKTDEDWYEGWSIENRLVQRLGAGSEEGVD
ncbi:hypothetical protein DFS33DRAFT_1447548 [Desarmillaria ectypa]|nr:hypothetical protein DFS33DRAFT_1447548 [Desarmillaria ectypa]